MPVPSLMSAPVVVRDAMLLEEIGRLRILAWRASGELPSFAPHTDTWLDEHDIHALNFVVLFQGQPVAAARMCVHVSVQDLPDLASLSGYADLISTPVAAFTRLVVDPTFRGRGLSRQLDLVRLAAAQADGCRSALGVTHVPTRMMQLAEMNFTNLGESRYRSVSFAPSYVFSREIRDIERSPDRIDQ